MGRRGSKINISGIKMHHFFVPELMVAAVLVKTIVFDNGFLFFIFRFFFDFLGWVSQVFGVKSMFIGTREIYLRPTGTHSVNTVAFCQFFVIVDLMAS